MWGETLLLSDSLKEHIILTPTPVSLPFKIVSISCGFSHTIALDDGGGVWTQGKGTSGQLGWNAKVSKEWR